MKRRIYIDASTNIPYGSFYLKGLVDMFGKNNVKFERTQFSDLPPLGWNIRFIVHEGDKIIKVFVHTNDSYKIDLMQYKWCDVYGNVNANFNYYPKELYPKQISLVPSFGIRNFNIVETVYFSFANFFRSYEDIKGRKIYNKFAGSTGFPVKK